MPAPKSYKARVARCESAEEVLAQIALLPAHERVSAAEPTYARAFEQWIEENLPPEVKKKRPSTLDKEYADLERRYTEPRFPFTEEQISERSIEEKIAALEASFPVGLWKDDAGEPVTVAMALRSPEGRRRARELFHGRAAKLKQAHKKANWEFAVFTNLSAAFEESPFITDGDIDAFYGSGVWAAARAVALDRDGPFCTECGDYAGPFEVDHIVPLRECWHLRAVQSNLQVLCVGCHKDKHKRAPAEHVE